MLLSKTEARPDFAGFIAKLTLGVVVANALSALASKELLAAQHVEFDAGFVFGGRVSSNTLSRFSRGNPVAPGVYRASVYFNERWQEDRDVRFVVQDDETLASPCMSRDDLEKFNLEPTALSPMAQQFLSSTAGEPSCLFAEQVAPGFLAKFDISQSRLDVTVAQAIQSRYGRGYVSPSRWESGITAGRLNYHYNSFMTKSDVAGSDSTQQFLNLDGGVNVGGWQLRHTGAYNYSPNTGSKYTAMQTNVRHDVTALKSYVILGDFNTDGQLFDSIGLRGVMLRSEDRMLPYVERTYLPVIRGRANSNANVVVTQNGVIIYQLAVPPGDFVLTDVSPPGMGGDLVVTVNESSGASHTFKVPYSSMPQLLRPGRIRYQVATGKVHQNGLNSDSMAVNGGIQYGLSSNVTVHGGVFAAENFNSIAIGSALGTGFGAFALDYSRSFLTSSTSESVSGDSLRLTYSNGLPTTGTNLNVSVLGSPTEGYQSIQNAMAILNEGGVPGYSNSLKSQVNVSLAQSMNQYGSLWVSASNTNYWDSALSQQSFQLGYGVNLGALNLTVSASRSVANGAAKTEPEDRFSLTLRVPLGSGPRNLQADFTIDGTSKGEHSERVGVSGSAGEYSEYNYGAQVSRSSQNTGIDVNGSVTTGFASLSASAGTSSGGGGRNNQFSLTASGGIVVHDGGVTLAPYLGDTIAIIHAEDTSGAKILGGGAGTMDWLGYGVVPYLTPYSLNEIGIETDGLELSTELSNPIKNVIPRAGAIMKVDIASVAGLWALIGARQAGGAPLPMGAEAFDDAGNHLGSVVQGSKLNVRLKSKSGLITVKWGERPDQSCRTAYDFSDANNKNGPATAVGLACNSNAGVYVEAPLKPSKALGEPLAVAPAAEQASPSKEPESEIRLKTSFELSEKQVANTTSSSGNSAAL